MNSAVMPTAGTYRIYQLSRQEWADRVDAAIRQGVVRSSIGYQQNIDIIRQLTGHQVMLSKKETKLEDGDEMYIMRLKYRIDGYKGLPVRLEDFEFFHCTYYQK